VVETAQKISAVFLHLPQSFKDRGPCLPDATLVPIVEKDQHQRSEKSQDKSKERPLPDDAPEHKRGDPQVGLEESGGFRLQERMSQDPCNQAHPEWQGQN
jgi:hypothetical protein